MNVIDSKGAVLALFARQLQGGGPISVTDPEVARYFLSVNEVARLVIQATALSHGVKSSFSMSVMKSASTSSPRD